MPTAIEFNNISKIYRLGLVSTGTLSHDLKRWWTMNIRHQEDPYLTIGETNDRSTKGDSDYVWALKDIDFKVEQGDVVGIIGKNGAGKSTLLKILSRVTAPTTGTIRARGRIGSLLEVGTGFHPEMTGRENIYMNGAILGMTKQEITRKLDEIVDFSGCERYIDTPVKRYSSGMMVRLGFAVAAHLDPEILVVDEVLAVGDAEFQKKAIGKMQDVSRGEGRTVLFVSHNMASVQTLCARGILLANGTIKKIGTIGEVISEYLSTNAYISYDDIMDRFKGKQLPQAYFTKIDFTDVEGNVCKAAISGETLNIVIRYISNLRRPFHINIGIYNQAGEKILHLSSEYCLAEIDFQQQEGTFVFTYKKLPLPKGEYIINFTLWSGYERIDWVRDCVKLNVTEGDFYGNGKLPDSKENKVLTEYLCQQV